MYKTNCTTIDEKGGESPQGNAVGLHSEVISIDTPREGDDSCHVQNITLYNYDCTQQLIFLVIWKKQYMALAEGQWPTSGYHKSWPLDVSTRNEIGNYIGLCDIDWA
jgi:hypothetical protein